MGKVTRAPGSATASFVYHSTLMLPSPESKGAIFIYSNLNILGDIGWLQYM